MNAIPTIREQVIASYATPFRLECAVLLSLLLAGALGLVVLA